VRQYEPKVEELFGTISHKDKFRFYPRPTMWTGETLSVFVEATGSDLKPFIILYDYGEKALASTNFQGRQTQGTVSDILREDADNCHL
jgi:hypothetical protein